MKSKNQSGFTLIELLVVVAIIGILSSVVLASLNSARNRARDAAIRQQVREYITTLEMEWTETGSLQNHQTGWVGNTAGVNSTLCPSETYTGVFGPRFRDFCSGIVNLSQTQTPYLLHVGSVSGGNTYSVMAQLNNGNWYCRGSSGATYEGTDTSWNGRGCYANP
jgi:prepilin-type N-terminal cleavage/methylation domain-containing protein